MLLIAAIMMLTLTAQANQEAVNTEFTVTQVALDAANARAAEEVTEEDSNETQPEGGTTEEK